MSASRVSALALLACLAAGAAQAQQAVAVRLGDHGDYERLVFDWPAKVGYQISRNGDDAVITFDRAAKINEPAFRKDLPGDVGLVSISSGAKGTVVTLRLPPGGELRASASGDRVIADVVRRTPGAKAAASPPAAAAKPLANTPAPAAPASGTSVATTGATTPPPLSLPSVPSLAAPAGSAPSPKPPAPGTASAAAAPAAGAPAASGQAQPAAATPATPAAAAPAPPPPTASFSLAFSWDKPVGAALFKRAGYLWLVFDRKQSFDINLVKREGGEALGSIEQLPDQAATEIRMIVDPSYNASLRHEGALWIVDLSGRPLAPSANAIGVRVPAATAQGNGIGLDVADPGTPIQIHDPEVGDTMTVIPVTTFGAGITQARNTPAVDVLATVQGIALVPKVDDMTLALSREGVIVNEPNGLPISTASATAPVPAGGVSGAMFDVPTWMRGGPAKYLQDLQQVQTEMAGVKGVSRGPAFLQGAQFYFANGAAPECLGALAVSAQSQPDLAKTPRFIALRGACNALLKRWDLALPDLDNPALANDLEVQFWRAAAHSGAAENPGDWTSQLATGISFLHNYPKPLAWPMADLIAGAALASGNDQLAQMAVTTLQKLAETTPESEWVAYLTGAYDELANKFDDALASYEKAMAGNNQKARARASVADAELSLKMHKITAAQAADRLDHLRFAWRDVDFEFPLLKRLGELQAQAGLYGDALRSWRDLVSVYPKNRGTPSVVTAMHELFNTLYLAGGADKMTAVAAIGLYDEFRDLTPQGAPGDEMIAKLADRLAKVDLLDRAAELLKFQVTSRLAGIPRAQVGARLALLDLIDFQPQAALDALNASEGTGEPADLAQQRLHLRARSLADLGRVSDAITTLASDTTDEAGRLRAEIYWGKKDWPDAAIAFSELVSTPPRGTKMSDEQVRLLLSWATALSLAQDQRGLAALNRQYAPVVAGTTYQSAFSLLTGAPDKSVTDLAGALAKVKEAQGFATFMANYKEQVQAGELSQIN